MVERGVTWALLLALSATATAQEAGEDPEAVDADFLAYLAELESEEDDWTIVATVPKNADRSKEEPPRAAKKKLTEPDGQVRQPRAEDER